MEHAPIPLYTSLPPRMTRRDADGTDISDAYARACVDSWIGSGFHPVTVNSRAEDPPGLAAQVAIEQRLLDRDARALYGRPFPYLSDLLAQMRRHAPGVVALTNADILLRLSPQSQRRIRELRPGQCVICSRMDVDSPEATQGCVYSGGFDFFAFRTEDLAGVETGDLALGVPWWDYFLPLWFYLSGMDRLKIDGASVLHLLHEERWDKAMWFSAGTLFLPMLRAQFESQAPASPRIARYFAQAHGVQRPAGFKKLGYVRRQMSAKGRMRNQRKLLGRLCNLNITTLDGWGHEAGNLRGGRDATA